MSRNTEPGFLLDFIDPLFAVVLSLSFGQILVADSWIWDLTKGAQMFEFWVLMLGYLFVVLSWIGYHKSLRTAPLKANTLSGIFRFIVDVFLLMLFFLLLASFQDFGRVLRLIVVIFVFFVAWDVLKASEYPPGGNVESILRRGVTVFWLVFFFIIWVARGSVAISDWFFFGLASTGTILYRVHKGKLTCRKLLQFLGYSWLGI